MGEYTTREEVEKLGIIDPDLKEILDNAPPPPASDVRDYALARRYFEKLEAKQVEQLGPPDAGISQTTLTISMRDGVEHPCIVVKPSDSTPKGKPLIVLFFGGGYVMGSINQLVPEARAFASLFNAVTVCAGYRLAPENPFPAGAKDAWDTIQYIAANASSKFGADPSAGFLVGGVSAGASLSSIVTQLAKDNNLYPPITGQWLAVPGFLHESTLPAKYKHLFLSREQNEFAPGFNKARRDALVEAQNPDFSSPLYAPFNSKSGQAGLPPAYLQSCGLDPLRDDSLIYQKMLHDAGVKTRLNVYPGLTHGFWMSTVVKDKNLAARADIAKGVGWLLGVDVDDETARQHFKKMYP